MKTKIGIIVLVVVCAGLVIALVAVKKSADDQRNTDALTIGEFSNEWAQVSYTNDELRQVNLTLNNDLETSREAALALSNNLADASNALSLSETSLQGATNQIADLNDRIKDLTTQNQVLDQNVNSLSNQITDLNSQITDTQRQLNDSKTNNAFLTAELQQQMADKADLERKFNDLTEVRNQVKKLRDELFVERRLQWMREGINPVNQPKGAELLVQQRPPPTNMAPAHVPTYNLNVEVGSDGSVHVIPPLTNPPPATNPPTFLH